ncbi:hypothetical protein B296_00037160 [Ensete ventricosum]|uniref:Uncharacterized protein n=1 Tax=Ensete ventricosum TaxID=4639 RepID=A0A426YAE0_ENSVE|nr:hypothetical protein B296_00037160 [Ensete ventricosum]
MDGSPVSYPGGRLLEWWSSGRKEAPQLGSDVSSCKEVESGKSLYSESYRSFVLDNLTALKAYHVGCTTTDAPHTCIRSVARVGSTTSTGQLFRGHDDVTVYFDDELLLLVP